MCRTVMLFLLVQRYKVCKIMTVRHTNQIICQEKWKKLRFWKNEAQNQVGIFWQNPIFGAETFFQRPLENFLLTLRTCSRYLRGPPNLALCARKKKSWPHDAPIRFYVRKSEKIEILKNEAQNLIAIYFDNLICCAETNMFKVYERSA